MKMTDDTGAEGGGTRRGGRQVRKHREREVMDGEGEDNDEEEEER